MKPSLKIVKPTGDLTKEPDIEATVPVPLPCVMVQVNGPYTALDRKLWALLLHLGWDELETKSKVGQWHELDEVDVRRIVEKYSGTKDLEIIWQSALRLARTTVQYEIDDENDDRWEGVTSIFAAMRKLKVHDGKFRFRFPPELVPIFKQPGRFARLRVQFLLGLKSKYAVTLYELFESIANKREPVIEVTIAQLRQWLQVPEGKLTQWDTLWRRALKPAIDEIGSSPDEAGFEIAYDLIRGGRGNKVQRVRFRITKTSGRKAIEDNMQGAGDRRDAKAENKIPPLKPVTFEKARKVAPGYDVYHFESEWRQWCEKKGIVPERPDGHFLGFVKAKRQRLGALVK